MQRCCICFSSYPCPKPAQSTLPPPRAAHHVFFFVVSLVFSLFLQHPGAMQAGTRLPAGCQACPARRARSVTFSGGALRGVTLLQHPLVTRGSPLPEHVGTAEVSLSSGASRCPGFLASRGLIGIDLAGSRTAGPCRPHPSPPAWSQDHQHMHTSPCRMLHPPRASISPDLRACAPGSAPVQAEMQACELSLLLFLFLFPCWKPPGKWRTAGRPLHTEGCSALKKKKKGGGTNLPPASSAGRRFSSPGPSLAALRGAEGKHLFIRAVSLNKALGASAGLAALAIP